jgi:hypothetical protein
MAPRAKARTPLGAVITPALGADELAAAPDWDPYSSARAEIREQEGELTEGVEEPATAPEALEAEAATLEVMEARPPVEEAPPPMVIPEEAEVNEAPAPVAEEPLLSSSATKTERQRLRREKTYEGVERADPLTEDPSCPQASSS